MLGKEKRPSLHAEAEGSTLSATTSEHAGPVASDDDVLGKPATFIAVRTSSRSRTVSDPGRPVSELGKHPSSPLDGNITEGDAINNDGIELKQKEPERQPSRKRGAASGVFRLLKVSIPEPEVLAPSDVLSPTVDTHGSNAEPMSAMTPKKHRFSFGHHQEDPADTVGPMDRRQSYDAGHLAEAGIHRHNEQNLLFIGPNYPQRASSATNTPIDTPRSARIGKFVPIEIPSGYQPVGGSLEMPLDGPSARPPTSSSPFLPRAASRATNNSDVLPKEAQANAGPFGSASSPNGNTGSGSFFKFGRSRSRSRSIQVDVATMASQIAAGTAAREDKDLEYTPIHEPQNSALPGSEPGIAGTPNSSGISTPVRALRQFSAVNRHYHRSHGHSHNTKHNHKTFELKRPAAGKEQLRAEDSLQPGTPRVRSKSVVVETSRIIEQFGRQEGADIEETSGTVNQYTFLKEIGKGSYGTVKLALNNDDKRSYAIKIISKKRLKRKWISATTGSISPRNRAPTPITFFSEGSSGIAISASVAPKDYLEEIRREIAILKKISDHPNFTTLVEVLDDEKEDKLYMGTCGRYKLCSCEGQFLRTAKKASF